MRQVAAYRKDVNISTDPALGGRLKNLRAHADRPENVEPVYHPAPNDNYQSFGRPANADEMGDGFGEMDGGRKSIGGRTSMDRKREVMGRIPTARGSQVDSKHFFTRAASFRG